MHRTVHAGLAMLITVLALCAGLCPAARANAVTGDPWPPLGQLAGGSAMDAAIQGNYAYVATGEALVVLDISVPAAPHMVTYCDLQSARAIALAGHYAYLAGGDWGGALHVVDIADPANPVPVGNLPLAGPAGARDIAVSGNYAYIAAMAGGMRIIDISNPVAPVQVGSLSLPQDCYGIAVQGAYAYAVGDWLGLNIINVSNPASPTVVGTIGCYSRSVDVVFPYAYVGDINGYLRVIDISNPTSPAQIATEPLPGVQGLDVVGATAYVACWPDRFCVVDVTNAANPALVSWCSTGAGGVAVALPYVYVSAEEEGLRVISVAEPTNPEEVGAFNPYAASEDLAVSGDYVFTMAHDEFRVVQASDPRLPQTVGRWPLGADAYSIAAASGYAYVGTLPYTLRVLDVSDPRWPFEVGRLNLSVLMRRALSLRGGYAYVGEEGGLRVVDISNPYNPISAGFFAMTGNAETLTVADGYAYAWDSSALMLRILDLANPVSPVEVGTVPDLHVVGRIAVSGNYLYVIHDTFDLDIINIADRAHPAMLVDAWGGVFSPQDIAISGRYLYVADGFTGLRIVDISQPAHPVQVAYWQTIGTATTVAVGGGRVYVCDDGWGLLVFPEATPARISGQVRVKGTTTNITGATVKAYLDGILRGTATTDANGVYTIPALPSGQLVVTASKAGYISQTKASITARLGQTSYVNFNLDISGALSGQVKEQGTLADLQNATVKAYLGGVLKSTKTTNSSGIYLMDAELPAGTYALTADKPGYETQTKAGISASAGATTYVNFFLKRVALTGQVKRATPVAPVIGAAIQAYQGATLIATATSQAPYGIYRFGAELPAGTYTVIASEAGYVKQTKPGIAVTAGVATYVNFNLQVSGKLKGQVTEKGSGLPIIGATIYARTGGVVRATGTTVGPYGIYEIPSDLSAGTYTMLCTRAGYQDFGRIGIVVTSGATTYVNFSLQPQ